MMPGLHRLVLFLATVTYQQSVVRKVDAFPTPQSIINDKVALLKNIDTSTWLPSTLGEVWASDISLYGPNVFSLFGNVNNKTYLAGGRIGNGRFIASSHSTFINFNLTERPQFFQLWYNILHWNAKVSRPTVGIIGSSPFSQIDATKFGVKGLPTVIQIAALNTTNLNTYNILFFDSMSLNVYDTVWVSNILQKWAAASADRTLLLTSLNWIWVEYKSGQTENNPANLIVGPYGVYYTNGAHNDVVVVRSAKADIGYENIWYALEDLKGYDPSKDTSISTSNPSENFLKFKTLASASQLSTIPTLIKTTFLTVANKACPSNVFSNFPILSTDVYRRTCAAIIYSLRFSLPLNMNHPITIAAAKFPGIPSKSISSTTKQFTLNVVRTKWQSTGLYAAPASTIKVTFCPTKSTNINAISFIVVGCTTDVLWQFIDDWNRFPVISESTNKGQIVKGCMEFNVSSFTGGLIYLNANIKGSALGTITINGRFTPAPWFTKSVSQKNWETSLSTTLALMGEIEADSIVFCYTVQTLNQGSCKSQPLEIVNTWNKILPEYYLLSNETVRDYKERISTDIQFNADSMHPGYPIMASTSLEIPEQCFAKKSIYESDKTPDILSAEEWAYFKMLGHNFQNFSWTFDAFVEGTANIFTLRMTELWPKYPDGKFGPVSTTRMMKASIRISSNSTFLDPSVALLFFLDLRLAFGWEAYRQTFAKYLALKIQPINNQEKIDTWMKLFSQTVGYNIYDFMATDNSFQVTPSLSQTQLPSFDLNTFISCAATSSSIPKGKAPCMSITLSANTKPFEISLSTWATIRPSHYLVISLLVGSGSPENLISPDLTENGTKSQQFNLTLSGTSSSLFQSAFYVNFGYGKDIPYPSSDFARIPNLKAGRIYLAPKKPILFDTFVSFSLSFSKAGRTVELLDTQEMSAYSWIENVSSGEVIFDYAKNVPIILK